jgi:hypothetical protein
MCVPTDKPGTCPAFSSNHEVCHQQHDECQRDCDCEGTKKCCRTLCSRVCIEPAGVCGGIVCPRGTVCNNRPPKPKCVPIIGKNRKVPRSLANWLSVHLHADRKTWNVSQITRRSTLGQILLT